MSEKIARRRKAKKIATIVGATGLAGVTLFSIIAFLGRVSGNFTVNINQSSNIARLQLSETKDFASPSVHLKAPGLDNASCASSDDVLKVGDEANIAENGGSYSEKLDEIRYDEDGNEISRINRGLIYSCFLLNPSSVAVKFDLSLVMTGYSSPSNAAVEPYSLLRVGIWHTRYAMDGMAEASLFKCFAADNTTVRYSGDGIRIEDDPREYVGESHLMRGTHSGENITYRRLDQTIANDSRSQQKADSFTGYLGGRRHLLRALPRGQRIPNQRPAAGTNVAFHLRLLVRRGRPRLPRSDSSGSLDDLPNEFHPFCFINHHEKESVQKDNAFQNPPGNRGAFAWTDSF